MLNTNVIPESRVELHSSQVKVDKMQQDLEEAGRNVRYLADAAKRISSLHFILGYRSSSFQVQVEI